MNKFKLALFVVMNIVNYVLVVLACLLWKCGSMVIDPIFLVLQPVLVVANLFVSQKNWQFIILSFHLLISTIAANAISGLLYYSNIAPSSETLLVCKYEIVIGGVYVAILSVAAVLIKRWLKQADRISSSKN
ncbi:MAG: hypothetical protein K6F76_01650 [Clostridiales bacterium]|nr:hypothetical protein [Clostridiales bacterium]